MNWLSRRLSLLQAVVLIAFLDWLWDHIVGVLLPLVFHPDVNIIPVFNLVFL